MAGAGYKLFNTGDVLTAAQVNTYLQEQTVMVFASSTARTTALSGVLAEGMMSYLQDTNSVEVYNGSSWVALASGDVTEVQAGTGISVASGTGPIPVVTNTMATAINAAGDLIYGTANDTFTRLGIGTAGQVLKVNSGATAPEWGTVTGGGKVLQVVQTVKTDTFSSTSTSYTDITGLSASITPASASNTVLVLVTVQGMGRENVMGLRLVRGATAIGGGTAAGSRLSAFAANKIADFDSQFTMSTNYLDSPATTSSTTYKVQFVINAGTGFINRSSNDTDAAYSYRTASTITLLEIGA